MKETNCMKQVNGKVKTVLMTPTIGEHLLLSRDNERTVTDRHVNAIAKSIEMMGWGKSMISATESGELLDGQHRLLALRKLGWPKFDVPIMLYRDLDVTPELRAMFNKGRPQSIRDIMKLSYGWDSNSGRKVSVYRTLTCICCGDKTPVDEYTMLAVDEKFPIRLYKFIHGATRELPTGIKTAFILAGLVDGSDHTENLYKGVADMIFTSTTCHARRIFDYVSEVKTNRTTKSLPKLQGHGISYTEIKHILYAIDMYLKGKPCPALIKVDDKKVEEVATAYISAMKMELSFN